MEDISPELYSKIIKTYTDASRADSKLIALAKKIKAGKGTQADLAAASERLGKHASNALRETLLLENLPDNKMYWNIADKTIRPLLENVHTVVNGLATYELRAEDIRHGVNVAVKVGRDPYEHIRTVMGFASNSATQAELDAALTEPIKTTALDFLDDFQSTNAEERAGVGVKQYVVRTYDGVGLKAGDCHWCIDRAGTWDYEDAKNNGVFERHPGCGCTIEVVYEDDLKQDDSYGSVPF